jgi:hypothetical protein
MRTRWRGRRRRGAARCAAAGPVADLRSPRRTAAAGGGDIGGARLEACVGPGSNGAAPAGRDARWALVRFYAAAGCSFRRA